VSGILWLLFAIVLLSFDATSAATIGYLVAFLLLFAGVDEIIIMFVAPGWRWLHGLAGAIFLLGGIAGLMQPFQTFGILALLMGWYLLIKGFFDMATAIGFRHEMYLWGLRMAVGIAEILLGLWALGYPGRSAWLLLLWAGTAALFRGIGNLVIAFSKGAE
jgi:uncharacterized membrane protein HdeD (DUF308 family)